MCTTAKQAQHVLHSFLKPKSCVCVIKTDKDAYLELVYKIFPTPRKNKDS